MDASLLATLEAYYDAAPRPSSTTEQLGPFTLFLRRDPTGWPYYARPRLDLDRPVTPPEVGAVLERQRELGAPEAIEWVAETTPSLGIAARAAGLAVRECPLLVLPADVVPAGHDAAARVRVLPADDPDLAATVAVVGAGFRGTDEVEERAAGPVEELVAAGLLVMAAAYDEGGAVVGGGTHNPRGATTELTGIAVLPRARRRGIGAALTAALVEDARAVGLGTVFLSAQDDTVARVYERVGFVRVGTACSAEPMTDAEAHS